ncbi:hypothetical protein KR009_005401 [Drosophila setifemur]|nr:hypothetical protein KR009_005401 [Drosophila setifemur]
MNRGSTTAKNTVRRTVRLTRRMRPMMDTSKGRNTAGGHKVDEVEEETAEQLEKRILQQRVFLYIQLNGITKVPLSGGQLELHLSHSKNTLQKMQERYTTDTVIYQHEFDLKKPVFAMGVMQDDIEDMNIFSDNPLVISLYQRIPRHRKGEIVQNVSSSVSGTEMSEPGEGVPKKTRKPKLSKKASYNMLEEGDEEDESWIEERLELLSRGHCDLLQLFQRKRFISNITIYLYPEYPSLHQIKANAKMTACSNWHMYSILPILKNFNFTNLAFVTLESIYNVPEEIRSNPEELGLSISFRSRYPEGKEGSFPEIPWCTFFGFGAQIISDQNPSIVWENIKRDINPNKHFSYNQMDTSARIKLPRLFRMLLWEKDVKYNVNRIDPVTDVALINNSLHRFVINEEMRKILEEAVVHNDYELLLQLYQETPENVLYQGVVNPSIFGYPGVNYCRFACSLKPLEKPSLRETGSMGPMFCTLKICFFQPICEVNEPLDKFNESVLKRGKLRRCFDLEFLNENEEEDNRNILLELYCAFDDLIADLIGQIMKRDFQSIEEHQDFFCCQLGNLSNLLLKICGCDFNIRMPTKTNIEFREMLTHMYKELMDRIENMLSFCRFQSSCKCVMQQDNEQKRIIRRMDDLRMVSQVGQRDMAIHMFEEIKHCGPNRITFDFITLLNSVENLQFQQASRYFLTPRTTDWSGVYFTLLLQIYIDYMLNLRSPDEEIQSSAYANMLDSLRAFCTKHSVDVESWILLYSYYKQADYLPGMEFTRMKFENLYELPEKALAFTPTSLYELYLPVDFDLRSNKTVMNCHFYPVYKLLARLGAYGFAEVVFSGIEQCFSAVETYLMKTTLKILQRQINDKFKIMTLPTDNSIAGKLMRCYQLHINGSVEYIRGGCDKALKYFEQLLNTTDADDRHLFKLSFLRLGQLAFDRGNYELADEAFDSCLPTLRKENNFMANYGKGLALYHLNRLEEAIPFLSHCTEIETFIPDVWGYLATINLRLNRNKSALECWKMAKMYPELAISKSVYEELDKIKYSDVHLMVDDDGNPAEKLNKKDCKTL